MTTKELFEALLAGKKFKRKTWGSNSYIYLDENGILRYNIENVATFKIILDDDWQEYKEEILDKKEKEYLSAVIKPFRDEIKYIVKDDRYTGDREYIFIVIKNDCSITFPYFKKNAMYKGMELDKEYTLEELGL